MHTGDPYISFSYKHLIFKIRNSIKKSAKRNVDKFDATVYCVSPSSEKAIEQYLISKLKLRENQFL